MARSPGFHRSSGTLFGPLSPCELWPCPLYPSLFPAARITLPIEYWLTGKDKERMSCPGPGVSEYEQCQNERLKVPGGNPPHRVPEKLVVLPEQHRLLPPNPPTPSEYYSHCNDRNPPNPGKEGKNRGVD